MKFYKIVFLVGGLSVFLFEAKSDELMGEDVDCSYLTSEGGAALSVGVIFNSDYTSEMSHHKITFKESNSNKEYSVKVKGAHEVFSGYDISTMEYGVKMFCLPLREGKYTINGIEFFQYRNGDFYTYSNKSPLSIHFNVDGGTVTYLGQYLAHKGFFYSVKNEFERDIKQLKRLSKSTEMKFVESVPKFDKSNGVYFKSVNDEYYLKLKSARLDLIKRQEEEEAEGD